DAGLTTEITAWANEAAGYAIVPGDTVYWKSPDLTVDAEGNNLYFSFLADLDADIATDFPYLDVDIVSAAQVGTPNADLGTSATITLGNQATFTPIDLPVGTIVWKVLTNTPETATFSV